MLLATSLSASSLSKINPCTRRQIITSFHSPSPISWYLCWVSIIIRVYFWALFRQFLGLCSTPRQCHRRSQIFTATRRFFQCRRECHFNGSFSRKKVLLTFWAFWADSAPKKPKVPFSFKNKPIKNDIPSIDTGKNPLGPREYPGRLVTLSKRGFRARCSKIKPDLRWAVPLSGRRRSPFSRQE